MNSPSLFVEAVSPAETALEAWRSAAAVVRLRWQEYPGR